jgi:hypothetical protein
MGYYHPIKEIAWICVGGLMGLLWGFKSGEKMGFDKGVNSERNRIEEYLTVKAIDLTRDGADRISLGQEPKTPYVNFQTAPYQHTEKFASNIVKSLSRENDFPTRLFNLGLYELGVAGGYREASTFVKSGMEITLRPNTN